MDFNYWTDDPARKPYSFEFLELLNINNFINHVLISTHVSDHALDLVLSPGDSDADNCLICTDASETG